MSQFRQTEGKTKIVHWHPDLSIARIEQKDDITAGDGADRTVIPGKGLATLRTATNVFKYLEKNGVATHFDLADDNMMLVKYCEMIPVEVVTRRIPYGSFLKRHPDAKRFDTPYTEYFLKDNERHDPLIEESELSKYTTFTKEIPEIALKVFLLLEQAWAKLNVTLVDLKIEFGVHYKLVRNSSGSLTKEREGQLLVADDISNDHWRIWENGDPKQMLDKQVYRDTRDNPDRQQIFANYKRVEILTKLFLED